MAAIHRVDAMIADHASGHFLRYSEAARALDVSRQRIDALVNDGRLTAVRNPLSNPRRPSRLITWTSIKRYALAMPRSGRAMGRVNQPRHASRSA